MTDITKEEVEAIVRATVNETLFSLGLNAEEKNDIEELRLDMVHLRKWRKSVEKMQSVGLLTAWVTIVTGLIAAISAGVLTWFK
jgi:hypothetical protein